MELLKRQRRLRRTQGLRNMVQETRVNLSDLIYPLFVVHGKGIKKRNSCPSGPISPFSG